MRNWHESTMSRAYPARQPQQECLHSTSFALGIEWRRTIGRNRGPRKERMMSTFQTMISLVLLIFVLSVMVQAIQEVLKAFLNTKSAVLKQIVTEFMGQHLSLQQVEGALTARGLNVTALEHFDKQDFRQLLEGSALH